LEPENSTIRSTVHTNNRVAVLVAASVAAFFTAFNASALNVALPTINQEFQADAILLTWVVTVFGLAIAVLSVPFGRVADIYGIKRLFLYGTSIFTVMAVVAVFSTSIIMLIICRAIQGIGCAMVIVTAVAMLTAAYPASERGKVLGVNMACVYIGTTVGPVLGGVLTEYFGWRSIFLFGLPLCLLTIGLLMFRIQGETSNSRGEKFDLTGSMVFGLALIALIYGFSLLPDIPGAVLTLAGILGLVAFVKLENKTASPILDIGIFRKNKVLLFANAAGLINFCATFAITFLMSLYLQYIKQMSPEQTGLILVVGPIFQAVFSPISGKLSDKLEPRIVATAGMILSLVGIICFIFVAENTPVFQVLIILAVVGTGMGLFGSPNANAVMSSVTPKYYGVAAALMGTIRGVGHTLSLGIVMIVMALIIGRVAISPDYYPALLSSIKVTFIVFSVLCFGGIFASLYKDKD